MIISTSTSSVGNTMLAIGFIGLMILAILVGGTALLEAFARYPRRTIIALVFVFGGCFVAGLLLGARLS